jgi:uncharacterized protein (TIRG00374 family)
MLLHGLAVASHASPTWVLLSVAAAAASFVLSAVGVAHASRRAVTVPTTTTVELAGAFCNRVTPAGLGRSLIRIRYLRCAGLSRPEVIAVTVVMAAAGGVAHGVGILIAATVTSHRLPLPAVASPALITAVTLSVLVGCVVTCLLVRSPRTAPCRTKARAYLRELLTHSVRLAHDRAAMAGVILGTAGSTTLFVLAFVAALHAAGITMSVSTAALVYLAGTVIANAAPVPGGLGAVEVALSAGLITAGAPPAPALGAVLIFRLASFWLPSIAGGFALLSLRRNGHLTTARPPEAQTANRSPIAPLTLTVTNGQRISQLSGRRRFGVATAGRLGQVRTAGKALLIGGTTVVGTLIGPGAAHAEAASTSAPRPAQTAAVVAQPTSPPDEAYGRRLR